eukprot:439408-Prorocentrum_minimum.AAC.4
MTTKTRAYDLFRSLSTKKDAHVLAPHISPQSTPRILTPERRGSDVWSLLARSPLGRLALQVKSDHLDSYALAAHCGRGGLQAIMRATSGWDRGTDRLSATIPPATAALIQMTEDTLNGTITFTGVGSPAQYQEILRTVSIRHTCVGQ